MPTPNIYRNVQNDLRRSVNPGDAGRPSDTTS